MFQGPPVALPDDSGLEPAESLFHLLRVVPLLETLTARLPAGLQVLFSLLTDSCGIPGLITVENKDAKQVTNIH